MAYTKRNTPKNTTKSTTKSVSTEKSVEPSATETIVVETNVEESNVIETKKEKRVFEQTDLIPCRSMVNGALYIEGNRSGILYSWADYDDVQEVEYRDLIYLVRTRNDKSIYAPRIIILDDDFIEQESSVRDFYDSMYTTSDLKQIFSLPEKQMIDEINKLPSGAKETVKGMAATMISSHALDSVRKIKALDKIFGTNMILTLIEE